jgi:hypothetical protein
LPSVSAEGRRRAAGRAKRRESRLG